MDITTEIIYLAYHFPPNLPDCGVRISSVYRFEQVMYADELGPIQIRKRQL